jgi:hypothetical protein
MYEFLQVWNAKARKISPKALIIHHPEFRGLFAREDAAGPYRKHWAEIYAKLLGTCRDIPASDRARTHGELIFVSKVEGRISSIVNEIARHIQLDYSELRNSGFEDMFRIALDGERRNQVDLSAVVQLRSLPVKARGDQKKARPLIGKEKEAKYKQKLEQAVVNRIGEEGEQRRRQIKSEREAPDAQEKVKAEQWINVQFAPGLKRQILEIIERQQVILIEQEEQIEMLKEEIKRLEGYKGKPRIHLYQSKVSGSVLTSAEKHPLKPKKLRVNFLDYLNDQH